MATIKPVATDISVDGSVSKVIWETITNSDAEGAPIVGVEWADRCVSVTGTFGGATLSVAGSNDGTNYYTLNNAQGTAATFTAAGIKQVVEVPMYIKPILTGGSGSDVDVIMIARRANSMRN